MMKTYLEDTLEISAIVDRCSFCENGHWEELSNLFHPEGMIDSLLLNGKISGLGETSRRVKCLNLRLQHTHSPSSVVFNRTASRAMSETVGEALLRNEKLDFGCLSQATIYDFLEKRKGSWKILLRQHAYHKAMMTFPDGAVSITDDPRIFKRHPKEYAVLAYLFEKSGFGIKHSCVTKGSPAEQAIRTNGNAWLLRKS